MADIDLKTETPDATLPSTGFLFGADSQAAASPSVYSTQAVATALLGSTSLTGATITADAPVLNLAQTWNAGAVTFTGLKANFTDTASASASLLIDLQVGGSSRFKVNKSGIVTIPDALYVTGASGVQVLNNNGVFVFGASQDVLLTRRGAANLRLGNADAAAPVAQTLSVQSVVAGTTNTAGANLTITGSQGTGTGAGGSIIFQVAPAGSSGTAQNALSTALEISSTRLATFLGDVGLYSSNTLRIGGSSVNWQITASTTGIIQGSNNYYGFFNGTNLAAAGAVDVLLYRDGIGQLALRNGTNAQTFNVYKTFTSASVYERIEMGFLPGLGVYGFASTQSGGGAANPLYFGTTGSAVTYLMTNSTARWQISAANGHFLASVDNTYDIGASGASRPRTIYAGTDIYLGQYIRQASNLLYIVNGAGILQLSNASNTDFGRLQFGGTTSSFPALKRSSTVLQSRLADDSDFAPLQGQLRTHNAYTAGAPTATGYIVLYDSTGTAYKVPAEAL